MPDSSEKVPIRNPFSTYDVFGFLIPGSVFICCIWFFELIAQSKILNYNFPILEIINIAGFKSTETSLVIGMLHLGIFLVMAYVVGHVISSLSSIYIDRTLVFKGYGYPFSNFLNIKQNENSILKSIFYKTFFFWTNLSLIVFFLITFIVVNNIFVNIIAYIILFAYLILLLFLIYLLILSQIPKSKIVLDKSNTVFQKYVKKLFVIFNPIEDYLGKLINTRGSFPKEIIHQFNECFENLFKIKANKHEGHVFWLTYNYVVEKSPIIRRNVDNWFHQYSFARNLATSFYCVFLYCFISSLIIYFWYDITNISRQVFIVPLLCFIISFILLYRYYYLYASYFNKYILRSFLFLETQSTETKPFPVPENDGIDNDLV